MALEPAKDMGDYVKAVEQVREQVAHLHAQVPPDRIPMWVVLGPGTSDHPGMYVARLWISLPHNEPTDALVRAGSLEELRDLLPPGLTRLERSPGDDPNIIETWV